MPICGPVAKPQCGDVLKKRRMIVIDRSFSPLCIYCVIYLFADKVSPFRYPSPAIIIHSPSVIIVINYMRRRCKRDRKRILIKIEMIY